MPPDALPAPARASSPDDRAAPARAVVMLLPDAEATARVGAALGRALRPGDAVLLEGALGAGKSALARAALAARLADCGRLEDIPSPTYTLVQCYETPAAALWHADLYRLSNPEEAAELGLTDALENGICLIEWPGRLGPLAPRRALRLRLEFPESAAAEGRRLTVSPEGGGWGDALAAIEGAL